MEAFYIYGIRLGEKKAQYQRAATCLPGRWLELCVILREEVHLPTCTMRGAQSQIPPSIKIEILETKSFQLQLPSMLSCKLLEELGHCRLPRFDNEKVFYFHF